MSSLAPQAGENDLRNLVCAAAKPPHTPNCGTFSHDQKTLIGRAEECQKICALLNANRLVTLVGPGGIGKTRLAQVLAAENLSRFQHGAYFIALSGVASPLFLVSAIAEAIHFPFRGSGDFKAQLLAYLRELDILLVLDNYEHLLPDTDLISEILQRTPHVRFLVTSRHHLDLHDEWVFKLPGLSYPDGAGDARSCSYTAVELFALRAQGVCSHFALGDENRADVISICQWVDGLPLAIELAASWTRALSCQEIAHQIEKDIDFLAVNWRDIPEKHRTMRGVLAQSWSMLDQPGQAILMKLAIFQGAITLDAAQQIAGASLQRLAFLVDRSLLQYEPSGCYKLHPLMQQYALEHLHAAGEFERIAERHSIYFTDFLQQQEMEIQGRGQRQSLEKIGVAIEDIRHAWDWALMQHREAPILQSMACLFHFYILRGYYRDGEMCFTQAANAFNGRVDGDKKSGITSKLAVRRAVFCRYLGDYVAAQAIFQEHLPILEKLGVKDEVVLCLRELTRIAYHRGAYADANRLGLDCLARCQKLGNTAEGIKTLHILSNVAREMARYDEARRFLDDALALSDAERFPQLHALCLQNLGILQKHLGNRQGARPFFESALVIFREIADQPGEAVALNGLGGIFMQQGDYSQAIRCYERAIPILREIGDQQNLGRTLGNLGVLFQKLGCVEQARDNLEQALALLRKIGERRGLCVVLSNLSVFFQSQGDYAQAQAHARELLTIAQSINDRTAQAFAWTDFGLALKGQGDWQAAMVAYQHALRLRQELGESHLTLEPLAGLAEIALAQGKLPLALEYVETILASDDDMSTSEESLVFLFVCYQVLRANQDARADRLLTLAHERLQLRAIQIEDQGLRNSYLGNVAANQRILAAYAQENTQSHATATETDLTRREIEVLRWMAAGHSNQEIADELCISLSTAKRHITNIHNKLGAKRRTQAISRAKELGLLG